MIAHFAFLAFLSVIQAAITLNLEKNASSSISSQSIAPPTYEECVFTIEGSPPIYQEVVQLEIDPSTRTENSFFSNLCSNMSFFQKIFYRFDKFYVFKILLFVFISFATVMIVFSSYISTFGQFFGFWVFFLCCILADLYIFMFKLEFDDLQSV